VQGPTAQRLGGRLRARSCSAGAATKVFGNRVKYDLAYAITGVLKSPSPSPGWNDGFIVITLLRAAH
jgi:hypothetical protein